MNWWIKLQERSRYLKPVEGDGGEGGGAPAEVEEEEVDPSAGMSEDEINDLLGDDSLDVEAENSPPAEAEEGGEAAPEEEAEPESDPEPEQTPIDDPQPEAEQEVEEQPQPEEETPEQFEAKKAEWLGKLAERYSISDEDAEALVTEPETVLPRLAANIHAAVMVDMAKAVEQMLPQLMGQFIQSQPQLISSAMQGYQTQQDAKAQFYQSYPQLQGNEETVKVAALTVQQNFGNLGEAEQLEKVGQIALAMLGITPQAAPAPEQAPAPAPFTPAKSGSAPPPAPANSGNVWDEFL